jgi:glycosyltransferase involved in cell wall biosynthesis
MSSLRILVNASTITVGGGVQATAAFIEYASTLDAKEVDFRFILSPTVASALRRDLREDPRCLVVSESPARILGGLRARREILRVERDFMPDIVYSMGFPSYVRFGSPEVGWYVNGWEICHFPVAFSALPYWERLLRLGRSWYRLRWAKNATYFHTETEIAKVGILNKLGIPPENVLVLPNSLNPRFINVDLVDQHRQANNPLRILCLAAAYRHKNLEIIPHVAKHMVDGFNLPCLFVLTIPINSAVWKRVACLAKRLNVSSLVENIGPLSLDECVAEYKKADCLFLPTLAEIFSATYLEAMAMQVPIVTTDLDFAHEVCKDAALYYSPLSAVEAAKALHLVLTKPALREELIRKGSQRLKEFPDPDTKHRMLMDWLIELAQRSRYCEAAKRGGDP